MFQSRIIVSALLALIAAGIIVVCAMFGRVLPLRADLAFAALPVVCFLVSLLHLRHMGLAFATAFAPVPGLLVVASLMHAATVEPLALAYLAGLTVALFLADDVALRVVEGSGVADAAAATLQENGTACCAVVVAASAFGAVLLLAGHHALAPLIATAAEFAACVSVMIVLPLVASLLPFSEDFVARANRLRERRERRLEKIIAITEPRWGWSLSGVGLVFFALAFFGSRSLHVTQNIAHAAPEIWLVAAVVVIGVSLAVTRDWRRALSILVALGLAALTGCWGYARAGVPLNASGWLALTQVLGVGAAMILLVANAAHPDIGEDAAAASARSLLGKTSAAVTSAACAIVVLLGLSWSMGVQSIALAVAIFFAAIGAILLQPALTIAIETVSPRRSTIEARYRVN